MLEVLVAFAILSISLGVLLRIFSTGMEASILSEEYTYATSLAESKLAVVGVETPYVTGTEEGKFGKYNWRTSVSPDQAFNNEGLGQGLDNPASRAVMLYNVKVEVFWRSAGKLRTVTLETLRLAPQ
ncbi:general secretion pathway protein H [Candidatus Nitrosoglobus terrae]|uniref:General secretion pathway protein H n=1 Tax=Candidatus Nitrosoglobus terrae TaxID=1630141 RepID=A0A1Q2SKQ3_9GAMM|nr:general secretion pathway protein H [Candidatus Nitrosoglobus terrae]